MKTILALGFVFQCALYSVASDPFVLTGCGKNVPESTKFFNDLRRSFARQKNISNMHELTVDPDLVSIASSFKSCAEIVNGPNYRVNNITDEDSMRAVDDFFACHGCEHGTVMMDREFYNPTQTRVGYCHLKEPYCKASYPAFKGKKLRLWNSGVIQYVKVYGPKTTFSKSDYTYGTPGTNCPHGTTEDGVLCKGPEIEKPKKNEDGTVASGGSQNHHWIGLIIVFTVIHFVYV